MRRRSDLTILLATGGAALAAALVVAALLLVTTGRNAETPSEDQPIVLGRAENVRERLEEGGPDYIANPTGGDGFWLALEDGEIVVLAITLPDRPDCTVDWRGRDDTFVDCDGEPVDTRQLARYRAEVSDEEDREGALLVDLQELLPPPIDAG
ncbi:MAG: hypothetical protein M5U14_14735 [Acidimicrobiia bacterium]|nr:hypothetical protein [Acidimicrobiia bacterium]